MNMIHLGVDLDDTIISTPKMSYLHPENNNRFNIKKSAQEYLSKLYNKGFKLHLITARDNIDEVLSITNKLENKMNITFTSVTLTYASEKGVYAKNKNCEYMIDDNPDFLMDCELNNVKPILLSAKKNKFRRLYPTWIICENWKEVYDILIDK